MRVLLVEDDPTLNRQLDMALQAAGYAVDVSTNGRDAWALGDAEDFDAVVLDLGLPQMDGLTVLKRWRAAGRSMPVLILTARDHWHEKVAGIDHIPGGLQCRGQLRIQDGFVFNQKDSHGVM